MANESACRFLDIPADELVGPLDRLNQVHDLDAHGNEVGYESHPAAMTLATGVPQYGIERGLRVASGEIRWCLLNTVPLIRRGSDLPYAVVMSFTDITERRRSSTPCCRARRRFRTLTESLPVGVYQADTEGAVTYVNPQMPGVVGITRVPETYEDAMSPVHPDDAGRVARGLASLLHDELAFSDQYRVIGDDGTVRWVSHRARTTLDESGNRTGIIGSIEDVTALIAAQEQNARLAGIIETTADLVGIIDAQTTRLVYLNRWRREVFGLIDQEIGEFDTASLYPPETMRVFMDSIFPALLRNETWGASWRWSITVAARWSCGRATRRRSGPTARSHRSPSSAATSPSARRFEADLAYQATHDSLTGLPNRALLLDHLELALARAERDDRLVALLFLDLDRFKMVNDTSATTPATSCSSPDGRLICRGRAAVATPWPASAATSSSILCEDVDDEDARRRRRPAGRGRHRASPFYVGDTEAVRQRQHRHRPGHRRRRRDPEAAAPRRRRRHVPGQGPAAGPACEIFDEPCGASAVDRLELASALRRGARRRRHRRALPAGDRHSAPAGSRRRGARPLAAPRARAAPPGEFIALAEETGLIVALGLRVLEHGVPAGHALAGALSAGARPRGPRQPLGPPARPTSNLPDARRGRARGHRARPRAAVPRDHRERAHGRRVGGDRHPVGAQGASA